MACATDPVSDVVQIVMGTLLEVFDPEQECPPTGGGSDTVRLFAGDGAPLAAWDAHAAGSGCKQPFLWVRAMRRYRSKQFPTPTVAVDCKLDRVVPIEIGVGRCAYVPDGDRVRWSEWADEAAISLSDSWRIEQALCTATARLTDASHAVGTDTLSPYGPEGGVVAWTAVLYVSY